MHQNGVTKWLESIHELITSIQPELRFSSVCYALDNTFYSKSIKHLKQELDPMMQQGLGRPCAMRIKLRNGPL